MSEEREEKAASHAVKMFENLADLCKGKAPRHGVNWQGDIYLGTGNLPASKNKFLIANACELVWCYDRKLWDRVDQILAWFVWYRTTPFTEGEELSCEEVYRCGMAYPCYVASVIAWARRMSIPLIAASELAASHVGWVTAGVGPAPRMSVRDHQQGANRGVVLEGNGKPKYAMRGVAQAGIRGCVRLGGVFLFTDRSGLSVMMYQALRREVPGWSKIRKNHKDQFDIAEGLRDRFPGAPVWGLSEPDTTILSRFFDEPTVFEHAERLTALLLAPPLPFDFDRYTSGAVASRMHRDRVSSTDDWIVDVIHKSGAAALGTCDDGKRPRGEHQHTDEETVAYACIVDGEPRPRVRVRKPDGSKAHTIQTRPDRGVSVVRPGTPLVIPVTPTDVEPPVPVERPSKRWYEVS